MSIKKFLVVFFAVGVLLSTPFFVAAESTTPEVDQLNIQIADKKKKIAEIEKAIEDYKQKISASQLQSVSLSNQMSILDNRISQIELDVQATENKLDELKLEISKLAFGIQDKTKIIERQKVIIAELLRNLYREDNKNYLEVLAVYKNFSDFYTRVQYLQKIQQDLGANAKTLRLAKEDLEAKKIETEKIQKEYLTLDQALKDKKSDLKNQVTYKQKLLSETQSSELKYKTLVSSLKAQNAQIEGEINSIETQVRKKLAEQQKKKPADFDTDSGDLSWPIGSRRVTAYFHDPLYPYRTVFEHNAIDIATSQGTAVRAGASGYVARAKRCTTASCYSYIMLIHSNGISTVYGHLSGLSVSEDQYVTRGDVIGYSGATPGTVGAGPFTTGPHLHFEVRKNGIPVNPLNYLN